MGYPSRRPGDAYEASKYVGTAKTATLRIEICPAAQPGGDWEY